MRSGGEFNLGGIVIKASPFPLDGGIGGSEGANEIREQVNGTVKIVQNWPRNLAWQHRKHVVDSKRHLQSLSHFAAQQRYYHPCHHRVSQAAMIRGRHRRKRFRDASDWLNFGNYSKDFMLGLLGVPNQVRLKDRILGYHHYHHWCTLFECGTHGTRGQTGCGSSISVQCRPVFHPVVKIKTEFLSQITER